MIKKFQSSDIFINTIKTYPKVSIFTYSGSMYYGNSAVTTDGVKLYDFLMEPQIIADQVLFFSETFENPGWNGTYNTGSLVYPTFSAASLLSETFENPGWNGTYNTGSLVYPTFTGSVLLAEEFENPGWNGTYNTGSLVYPTFTGSVLLAEEFESGSWPNI